MIKTMKINISNHFPVIILSFIYVIFSFFTYKFYGVTTDEPLEYQSAEKLLKFYQNGLFVSNIDNSFGNLSEDVLRHEPLVSMYYRGHLLLHAYLLSSKDFFELHFLNILLALPLFITVYYVFLKIFGKWYYAMLGTLFLLLDPRLTGHIPANPKDFPFASAVLIYVLLSYYFGIKKYSVLKNILLGLILGLVIGIRPIGVSILLSVFITHLLKAIIDRRIEVIKNSVFNLSTQVIVSFIFLVFTWPFFAINPVLHFFSYLFYGANFSDWSGTVFFRGEYLSFDKIPWEYLFVWLFNTTPVLHLFLVLVFFVFINKLIKNNLVQNILIIIGVNLLVYLIFSPLIYNSIRHYLFLTSLITLLCSYVLVFSVKYLSEKKFDGIFNYLKYLYTTILLITIFSLVKDNIKLFPYQNIYFNEISGGVSSMGKYYDTDYWHQSRLEASLWIVNNLNTYGEKIYVCNMSEIVKYYQPRLEIVKDKDDATVSICDPRRELERNIDGQIIHSISRENINLTNIRRLKEIDFLN
jgi:hypothetical protein